MVYRRIILACVVGALLSPAALLAQGGYFGRNKVQYQTFDFQVRLIRSDPRHQLNVSPEVNPDGTRFMFFSERDLFSIDLFLADANTGRVIRKITETATDPHFESSRASRRMAARSPSARIASRRICRRSRPGTCAWRSWTWTAVPSAKRAASPARRTSARSGQMMARASISSQIGAASRTSTGCASMARRSFSSRTSSPGSAASRR